MRKTAKILVVEDDASFLKALGDRLRRDGFLVEEALDGEEGLRLALENRPDLVLLDLRLPKMDGAEMMQKLREDKWGTDVPIIILTNYDRDEEGFRDIMRNKPSYYLLKLENPLSEVVLKVKEVLGISS